MHADYLSALVRKDVIPVGPLVRFPENKSSDSKFLVWLNTKDPYSTIFVSFGSECFLSEEEVAVIAHGLELSMVNFIWVILFEGRESLHEILPEGFQARVSGRAMVVKDWAPQARILSHPAIGGFVSHCGCSSVLESIAFGVPIVAMPMKHDQPFNASWAVDIGVAVEVEKENGIYNKEEIAKGIKTVVVEEKRKEVRQKVQEYSIMMKEKGDQEIDQVVEKILELVD